MKNKRALYLSCSVLGLSIASTSVLAQQVISTPTTVNKFSISGTTTQVAPTGSLVVNPQVFPSAFDVWYGTFIVDGGSLDTRGASGVNGNGTLIQSNFLVMNGGRADIRGSLSIDAIGGGTPVVITGPGSRLTVGGEAQIGFMYNSGNLIVSNGGSFSAGRIVVGGDPFRSRPTGTLAIGAQSGAAAAAPGTIDGGEIQFTNGSGTVVFNHTSDNYVFGTRIVNASRAAGGNRPLNPLTIRGTVRAENGKTIFTADNTYLGTTSITSGATLQLGNGGTTGSIVTDVTDNGTLGFDHSNDISYSGIISGTGRVEQSGAGALTLSGVNTYTGGTVISDGTLIGSVTSFGSGAITDDVSLVLNQATDADFANAVSGTGSLTKTGAGALTLIGVNTYAGGTLISDGTLIGSATSFGSGAITDNTSLVLDQATDAALTNAISGTGTLTKTGAGALTLSGVNTYAGGTLISEGTFIGSATSFGSGAITDNTSLVLDQATDGVLANTISGTGNFIKRGAGTLSLRGVNTYTGPTVVKAGTLVVGDTSHPDASLASIVTVEEGGRLQGVGTIGGLRVADGSVAAPGNSIGTMNVNGNITFDAGSRYEVETEPSGSRSDLISATGTATLKGGTVAHVGFDGDYDPLATYTILSATGGVTGRFSSVESVYAFLDPTLTYDPSHVYLTLARNQVSFQSAGRTHNQQVVGQALEGLPTANLLWRAAARLKKDDVATAFSQLSGEGHATIAGRMIDDSRFVRDAALSRLTDDPCHEAIGCETQGRPAVWAHAYGAWGEYEGDGNAAGQSRSLGGIIGGVETSGERWALGLLGGYANSTYSVDDAASTSASSGDYSVGAYGVSRWGATALKLGATYTLHDIEMDRRVSFGGLQSLKSDYDAHTTQVFGEVSHTIDLGGLAFEPFAGLTYVRHSTEFGESGGIAALSGSIGEDTMYTTLGLHASTEFEFAGLPVTTKATLGWRHALGDRNADTAMAFRGSPVFNVQGLETAADSAYVHAGLELGIAPNAAVEISYDGQYANGVQDHGLLARLQAKF